jgi:hypothetical protein
VDAEVAPLQLRPFLCPDNARTRCEAKEIEALIDEYCYEGLAKRQGMLHQARWICDKNVSTSRYSCVRKVC